jgi:hypothetical protein
MLIPIRDGKVVTVPDLAGLPLVRMGDPADGVSCKCCAAECESTATVEIDFCGMSVSFEVPIPGQAEQIASKEDESYLIAGAIISCTPCGWLLAITVCAFCVETDVFASDGFVAEIPFAAAEEPTGGHCPEGGEVILECFGDQFGIPCVTSPTVTIA